LGGQELVGGLDCTVHRNFFYSQVKYGNHFFLFHGQTSCIPFPGLEPMTAWSEGNSFTLLPFNFCFFWRTKSLNMKVNTMADCKLFSLQLQSFETELLVPKLAEKEEVISAVVYLYEHLLYWK
jgi:hypothetical protein